MKEIPKNFHELISRTSAAVARGSLLLTLDGKNFLRISPFGAIPQLPHGNRLRAQSARVAREVTGRFVMSKPSRYREPLWIIHDIVNQRLLHLPEV